MIFEKDKITERDLEGVRKIVLFKYEHGKHYINNYNKRTVEEFFLNLKGIPLPSIGMRGRSADTWVFHFANDTGRKIGYKFSPILDVSNVVDVVNNYLKECKEKVSGNKLYGGVDLLTKIEEDDFEEFDKYNRENGIMKVTFEGHKTISPCKKSNRRNLADTFSNNFRKML